MNLRIFSIIFLNVINLLFASKDETKIIPTKTATSEDVQLLVPFLRQNEVLPLILIQPGFLKTLQPPESMDMVILKNGRFMPGTEFYTSKHDRQLFFCPSKKPQRTCLVPRRFKSSQPLQCDEIPELAIRPIGNSCGPNGIGKLHKFVYEICDPPQRYEYITGEFIIYEFCYDHKRYKTLYTEHTIQSPLLLDQQLMIREREVKFETLTYNYELDELNNYSKHFDQLYRGTVVPQNILQVFTFPYQVQKLVPPDHMAFALWRKPASHYINNEFLHNSLITLWDEISNLVRLEATKMYSNIPYHIFTGVFSIREKVPQTNGIQLSTIWVQMISTTFTTGKRKGISIIMDNFIYTESSKDNITSSEANKPIGRFCEDLCDENIKRKFADINGRVNCCPISEEIQQLFGTELQIDGLLRISDLIQS